MRELPNSIYIYIGIHIGIHNIHLHLLIFISTFYLYISRCVCLSIPNLPPSNLPKLAYRSLKYTLGTWRAVGRSFRSTEYYYIRRGV